MTIVNEKEFMDRMRKRLGSQADKKIARTLFRSVLLVRETAVTSIASGSKTGRTYKRGTKLHTASAAGEAPATDSGVLASSITTDVDRDSSDDTLVGFVKAHASDGSGGNYALHLEFGTRTMAARPFMQPALQKNEARIKKLFQEEGIIDK